MHDAAAAAALVARAVTLRRTWGSQVLAHSDHRDLGADLFLLEQAVQPRILLLGAGADALPVAKLALFLGWSVTVVDHRSHYAQPARFPGVDAVMDGGPCSPRLGHDLSATAGQFDAAIVMSHHLLTDAAYLRALVLSSIPYIGLLGPIVRRERLLAELGAEAARLRGRLTGYRSGSTWGPTHPESIALAIVAEIQAVLSGTAMVAPLSAKPSSASPADARSLRTR